MDQLQKIDYLYDCILGITKGLEDDGHREIAQHFEREYTAEYDKFLASLAVGHSDGDTVDAICDRLSELTGQLEQIVKVNALYNKIKPKGDSDAQS